MQSDELRAASHNRRRPALPTCLGYGQFERHFRHALAALRGGDAISKHEADAQEMKRIPLAATLFFALQSSFLPSPVQAQLAPSASELAMIRKTAEQGNAIAQTSLGRAYQKGEGVPQDYVQAVYWLRKAAEQGDAIAQYFLGRAYQNGEGVPQDYLQAANWFRKSAEQGNDSAQTTLGRAYRNGEGVPQDYVQAAQWFRKAAEQGADTAQTALGLAYMDGEGVPQDFVLGYAWLNIAASQFPLARSARDTAAERLSPTQLAEAQRLSSNWRKGRSIQREKQ